MKTADAGNADRVSPGAGTNLNRWRPDGWRPAGLRLDSSRLTGWWPRRGDVAIMSVTDQRRRFWVSYLTITFGVQCFLSVALIGYLLATADAGYRGFLLVVGLISVVVSVVGMSRSRWLAAQGWRSGFWLCWLCGSCGAQAMVSSLDGGLLSPLLFTPILPVMSAMLGLSPRRVAVVAGVAVAGLVVVFLSDPLAVAPRPNMLMRLALVLCVVFLAVAAAVQRAWMESRQAVLLDERTNINARLVAAQELAHVGTFEVDADGQVKISDEMYRIAGVSPEVPASGDILWDHVHPDDLQRVHELFVSFAVVPGVGRDGPADRAGQPTKIHRRF